jgi:hypothetical protein
MGILESQTTRQGGKEMRGTKEFQDVMNSFEKSLKSDYAGYIRGEVKRLDPHGRPVDGCPNDQFYGNGEINQMFKIFFLGYMSGRAEYMNR